MHDHRQARIIPAYAGSTTLEILADPSQRDHPRIRGEHLVTCISDARRAGSSPHTRGAPGFGAVVDPESGIIPAYAGSTEMLTCFLRSPKDHPRIRGEHSLFLLIQALRRGSSPHTRGARTEQVAHEPAGGIIPAYAGSTPGVNLRGVSFTDHPRIRGEHWEAPPERPIR